VTTLDDKQAIQAPVGALALIGVGWLALGCAPKVSADIVVSDPEPKPEDEADADADEDQRDHGDRLPPQILRAEMVSEGVLRIHFSEPIAELDGFDPNDFRVSVLNVYRGYDYGYPYPGGGGGGYAYPAPGSNDWASYADFGYDYYGDPLRFADWKIHGGELTLMFSPPLGPDACRMISYSSYHGSRYTSGLFLHYAAGAIPIRDESGYPLANFGADWVLEGRRGSPGDNRELSGAEVEQAGDGLIPIDCSPQLPPGPR